MIDRIFLDYSGRKLRQYFERIRSCLDKLSGEQIWLRGGENQNAAGNLLLHLAGNVRQWIVSGVGGQPDVRVRDREFAARGDISKQELLERLEAAVNDAIVVLDGVTAKRLEEHVTVQNYDGTVLEAIGHVVEHFAMHTGQIIFLTKALTGEDLGFYRHLSAPQRGTAGRATP
jgi:uncharacterized damage-inducible protein DinB